MDNYEILIEYIGETTGYEDLVIFTSEDNSYYSCSDYWFEVG